MRKYISILILASVSMTAHAQFRIQMQMGSMPNRLFQYNQMYNIGLFGIGVGYEASTSSRNVLGVWTDIVLTGSHLFAPQRSYNIQPGGWSLSAEVRGGLFIGPVRPYAKAIYQYSVWTRHRNENTWIYDPWCGCYLFRDVDVLTPRTADPQLLFGPGIELAVENNFRIAAEFWIPMIPTADIEMPYRVQLVLAYVFSNDGY